MHWKEVCSASFYLQSPIVYQCDFHTVFVSWSAESRFNSLTFAEMMPVKENDVNLWNSDLKSLLWLLLAAFVIASQQPENIKKEQINFFFFFFKKEVQKILMNPLKCTFFHPNCGFNTCYSRHMKDKWLTLPKPWELYGPPALRAPLRSSCNSTPESQWATAAGPRSARTSLSLRSLLPALDWLGRRNQKR